MYIPLYIPTPDTEFFMQSNFDGFCEYGCTFDLFYSN